MGLVIRKILKAVDEVSIAEPGDRRFYVRLRMKWEEEPRSTWRTVSHVPCGVQGIV
tara:strand:- start:3497 stop:3664 length:168 start_codon:yes stop_codon:yes gene_type:complete